jgi:hypothetical protein
MIEINSYCCNKNNNDNKVTVYILVYTFDLK